MVINSENFNDVHKIILALLISRKEPTSVQILAKDYFEQEGESIPWKELGHASLVDYLKSMPNCVSLEKNDGIYYARGIASNKSKHISSLVARQKTKLKIRPCVRKYRPSHYYPITSIPKIHIPADILSNLILIIKQSPNGINKDYALKWLHNKLPDLNLSMTDLEKTVRDMSHKIYIDGHRIFSFQNEKKSDQCWFSKSLPKVENENLQSKDSVKSKYFVSGDTESENESDDDVAKKNRMINSKDNKNQISSKKQSTSTFIQKTVSKSCKTDDHMQHYSSESNTVLDNSLQKLREEDIIFFNKKNIRLLINDRKIYQLEKLIEKYPNGIWCADLPKKYQEEYNVSLNYNELGFNSVREFASYLPEIFQCRKLPQSEDFILYDAKAELTDINKTTLPNKVGSYTQSYLMEDETDALPVVLSNDTSNKLIPEDVMALGESVGQIYVKDIQNRPQQYVQVCVVEVFMPSLFWINLYKERKHLTKLMDALHIFYEENFLNYKIPIAVLEKGLNCACKYDKIWHRGIIKSVRYDLYVTVMFYDYGTLKTYPPEEIFYLHRAFSYLSAQAIPCGLYNVKPIVGDKWSRDVTEKFASKTLLKPLVATIVSTDPEKNSMLVTLADTVEEEDVHINDWMVHQNLAVHGKMGDVVDMNNLMSFVEGNILYDLDKCYEKDYYIPNEENDKTCEKYLKDIPLISPQSTLPEQSSKTLFHSSFCDDFTKLAQKNSDYNPFLNVHNDECNNWEDVQAGIKMSTNNPFFESINKQTKFINTLSPEMFMQILKTNEKIQKQILFIFSSLIVKLDSAFIENNYHSPENELKKSYEERLLHASEFLENIISKEDILTLLTSKPTNCFNNTGFQSDQSNGMFTSLFANNNNYVVNGKSEINDYNANKVQYKPFEQINDTNNIVLNSKPQVPYIKSIFTDHDKSAIINSCQEKSAMTELKTKTAAFPYQNDSKDINENQFNTFDSILKGEILYNEYNETNPFKIILKLKECKDLNAVQVEDNKLDFEKYYLSDCTNFDQNRIEMNNTHDHESTKQYNDYMSEFPLIDNNRQYTTSNMYLGTSLFSENDYFHSSNNYSTSLGNNETEELINSTFLSSLNNLSISDEFRFDRQNFRPNSEVCFNMPNKGCIKELQVNNSQESLNIPGRTLLENVEKALLSQVNVPNESHINQSFTDSIGMFNINQQYQTTVVCPNNYEIAMTNFDSQYPSFPYREHINNDERNVNHVIENNIGFQNYNGTFPTNSSITDINHREQHVENEHDNWNTYFIKTTKEEINVPWNESLVRTDKGLTRLYFRITEINRKKFCIFHLENQGWIDVNDFVEEFTNYKTVLEFYEQLQHDYLSIVNFKKITRLENLTPFFQYNEIITYKDINDVKENGIKFTRNAIVYKVWMLIRRYGELKPFIPEM
ncbi:uncharacterized protein LOC122522991 isoform X2 [Polistes fuscatus]|uniref:uncharacterized protein LOC122522991 isoform X2 n=1 Tax=Polistes fuscatus TaxID=30207 RepID=UPI001CA9A530|nr:uncharacterized protein LOC122522991 isoform X2 [Polistes fuscatus]